VNRIRFRSPGRLRRCGLIREDGGQALVELALALPLLLLILVGIFEFARAYSIKQTLVNAAREGARTAVVQGATGTPNDSLVRVVVNSYASANNVSVDSTTITAAAPDGTARGSFGAAQSGDAVSVTVYDRYEFLLIGPVLGLIGETFRDGVNLGSRATMRME
jgi:Flp pilus assembly protein TadG